MNDQNSFDKYPKFGVFFKSSQTSLQKMIKWYQIAKVRYSTISNTNVTEWTRRMEKTRESYRLSGYEDKSRIEGRGEIWEKERRRRDRFVATKWNVPICTDTFVIFTDSAPAEWHAEEAAPRRRNEACSEFQHIRQCESTLESLDSYPRSILIACNLVTSPWRLSPFDA